MALTEPSNCSFVTIYSIIRICSPYLYGFPYGHPCSNQSMVNCEDIGANESYFGEFGACNRVLNDNAYRCVLREGDLLYIPSFWWYEETQTHHQLHGLLLYPCTYISTSAASSKQSSKQQSSTIVPTVSVWHHIINVKYIMICSYCDVWEIIKTSNSKAFGVHLYRMG
eukprot:1247_1